MIKLMFEDLLSQGHRAISLETPVNNLDAFRSIYFIHGRRQEEWGPRILGGSLFHYWVIPNIRKSSLTQMAIISAH